MGFMSDLVAGVATTTASSSGGLIKYRPNGGYLASEIGLYRVVLPETPDRAVAMTLYPISDLASDGEPIVGLQFRYRAKTNGELDDIEDALTSCWSRRRSGTLGAVRLVQSVWSSGASLGQDANDRLMRSVNYYLTVHRPNFENDNI